MTRVTCLPSRTIATPPRRIMAFQVHDGVDHRHSSSPSCHLTKNCAYSASRKWRNHPWAASSLRFAASPALGLPPITQVHATGILDSGQPIKIRDIPPLCRGGFCPIRRPTEVCHLSSGRPAVRKDRRASRGQHTVQSCGSYILGRMHDHGQKAHGEAKDSVSFEA
jgi:hypothetical protein